MNLNFVFACMIVVSFAIALGHAWSAETKGLPRQKWSSACRQSLAKAS